ncbi:max-like protein X [Montipora capricornis]
MADDGNDWGAGHQLVSVISSGSDHLFEEPVESTDVKSEPASPDEDTSRTHFDSQDEDNDVFVAKEQRRFAHSAAEQKRRDAIRKGYDDLQHIVPTCHQPNSSTSMQKLSKAIILQKSIEYIMFLHQQKKKQEEELEALRKEVMALKIMKTNYEQIAKAHQNQPVQGKKQVPDQAKFSVFRQIMETQFLSFNASVTVTNFEALSACIFSWLEEYCKPQYLQEIVINALKNLNNQGLLQQ